MRVNSLLCKENIVFQTVVHNVIIVQPSVTSFLYFKETDLMWSSPGIALSSTSLFVWSCIRCIPVKRGFSPLGYQRKSRANQSFCINNDSNRERMLSSCPRRHISIYAFKKAPTQLLCRSHHTYGFPLHI